MTIHAPKRVERDFERLSQLDAVVEPILQAAKIPGGAIAIVAGGKLIHAKAYGYRDLEDQLPMATDTVYPIASTTKAFNATLLGMLVDEGAVSWDHPVQRYLPRFRLGDLQTSGLVTIRDLIVMRTGLPRHDWAWAENPTNRADLMAQIAHLELSCGFRERYQYNNLTVTAAGHVAEVVTGQSWEELVQHRILDPLGMTSTSFALPSNGNETRSYYENSRRGLLRGLRYATEVTAPSGGSVHSTVLDMARWVSFNLAGGKIEDRPLIKATTLAEIHSPQIAVGAEFAAVLVNPTYAMGWFVDTYNGRRRISHGGDLHDVNSDVSLFPQDDLGIVTFTNLGGTSLGRFINQQVFDLIMGLKPAQSLEEKLSARKKNLADTRARNAAAQRVENTVPSHRPHDYAGVYVHPGYGGIEIRCDGGELALHRNRFVLPMEHWHYDAWVARDTDRFDIELAQEFGRNNPVLFSTDTAGRIDALLIRLEPAVAAIRFVKQ